jgi:hypothetical protein
MLASFLPSSLAEDGVVEIKKVAQWTTFLCNLSMNYLVALAVFFKPCHLSRSRFKLGGLSP